MEKKIQTILVYLARSYDLIEFEGKLEPKQLSWFLDIEIWILIILQKLIPRIIEILISNNTWKEYPKGDGYMSYNTYIIILL